MNRNLVLALLTGWGLLLTGAGCAQIRDFKRSSDDLAVKQAQRTAETVQVFEKRRDFAQLMAARARWREGNSTACRESLEQILQRNPGQYEARLLLAEVLLADEQFEAAISHLETAIEQRAEDPVAQHLMALVLQSQGRDEEALAYHQRAAELEPDNAYYASACKFAAGNFPEVQVNYQSADGTESATAEVGDADSEAPGLLPDQSSASPPGSAARLLSDAQRQLAAGDATTARRTLQQAVATSPDDVRLTVRAAVLALRAEQSELAVALLEPAAMRHTDSAVVHRTLATAYYRQKEYYAAQRSLERALSLDKSNALAYLLMGCTLEKLGNQSAAKSYFDEAGRLDPRLSARRMP